MQDEEIDLVKVYQSFQNTKTYIFLHRFFTIALNNKLWLAFFFIIGLALGYYKNTFKKPTYKTDLLIESQYISSENCKEIINYLDILLIEKNYKELHKYNFDSTIATILNTVVFSSINDKKVFKLIIEISDNTKYQDIETNLVNFLNNNKYVHSKELEKEDSYLSQKKELLEAKANIDSALFNNSTNNQDTKMLNSSLLLVEKNKLDIELIKVETELKNVIGMKVLRSITPRLTPEKMSKLELLLYGILSSLIGLTFLLIIKK